MKAEEQVNQTSQKERRDFIKTATKLSGIFALLGISAESLGAIISAQGEQEQNLEPRARAIRLLFIEAMDKGDMGAAIDKYRKDAQLDDNQVRALMSITKEELAALKSLRDKLLPLKIPGWAVMTTGANSAAEVSSGIVPPYGLPIREAIARGNLQEMKDMAAATRKWLAEVNSALDQLESSIRKIGR